MRYSRIATFASEVIFVQFITLKNNHESKHKTHSRNEPNLETLALILALLGQALLRADAPRLAGMAAHAGDSVGLEVQLVWARAHQSLRCIVALMRANEAEVA